MARTNRALHWSCSMGMAALVDACGTPSPQSSDTGIVVDAASPAETLALVVPSPAGFPQVLPTPSDNPLTEAKAQLGKKLFFEKRLSRTEDVSCGTCHLQANGFAEPRRVSQGVEGRTGERNAPALINLAYNTAFFWDGGAESLERQSIAPLENPVEMDLPLAEAIARLEADPKYEELFGAAFDDGITQGNYTRAIASFVRTLVSGNSPYDRYLLGDERALSASAKLGLEIFMGERGECFHCHVGFNFTNNRYAHNGSYEAGGDRGRERLTLNPADVGRFKVPTLRNVGLTAPYMHDGSLATLADVVQQYSDGGRGEEHTDPLITPLMLSPKEKAALVSFLEALTDEEFANAPRFAEGP